MPRTKPKHKGAPSNAESLLAKHLETLVFSLPFLFEKNRARARLALVAWKAGRLKELSAFFEGVDYREKGNVDVPHFEDADFPALNTETERAAWYRGFCGRPF